MKKSTLPPHKNEKLDPVFTIFEHHLMNFSDGSLSRAEFIQGVIADYFRVVRQKGLVIPQRLETYIVEELTVLIQGMLTKKTYGFLTLDSYRESLTSPQKKQAKSRYSKLG